MNYYIYMIDETFNKAGIIAARLGYSKNSPLSTPTQMKLLKIAAVTINNELLREIKNKLKCQNLKNK